MKIKYQVLDKINSPADLKKLSTAELLLLAEDVRKKTIESVSKTGGHLGAGLGVVELTVALHYVFDTPKDKLIWDVGHQTYPHKILTGRKDRMDSLRQAGGLSGFTKITESEYDEFGAGHSSTSISAAAGIAIARDLNKENHEVIAVIGDGSISAGMAYEAMNNAGSQKSRLIVILNDNDMSIAPAVGSMSKYLSKLISSKSYLNFRKNAKKINKRFPNFLRKTTKKFEKIIKDIFAGGNFFEEMGFYYIGPVDGHKLEDLIKILKNVKNDSTIQKPILIHVATEKGYGYEMPEAKEKLHAVAKFDLNTGIQKKDTSKDKSYTEIFSKKLIDLAIDDQKIVAITAAMPSGTGLDKFEKIIKDRFFDVGIAEQHAVTFAAGLALKGFKPYCAIYSTFLQRAYDQVIHDVAIQSLPVRFMIDRAGYVGADGATHAGCFDISYLSIIPNFIVMAPSCANELIGMMDFVNEVNDRPTAIRYPRGKSCLIAKKIPNIRLSKANIIQKGEDIAILSLGTRLQEIIQVADELNKIGVKITLIDARFAKPIDKNIVNKVVETHKYLITIEEGSIGGFAAQVSDHLINTDSLDKIKFKALYFPDEFIDHNDQEQQYKLSGMDKESLLTYLKKII